MYLSQSQSDDHNSGQEQRIKKGLKGKKIKLKNRLRNKLTLKNYYNKLHSGAQASQETLVPQHPI